MLELGEIFSNEHRVSDLGLVSTEKKKNFVKEVKSILENILILKQAFESFFEFLKTSGFFSNEKITKEYTSHNCY